MSTDADRFKDEQKDSWDAVAEGWNRWWRIFEDAAQPVSDRLVDLATIGPGVRVLDIATGLGEPALTAARRVGRKGAVTAIDHAPTMLRLARRRARAVGLGNVDFQDMDADALAFADGTFDAALSRWGLMFMPDLDATLRGIRTVLRPGGRFAAAVWAPPSRVPMIALSTTVLDERVPLEPPAGPALGPFRLAEEGTLENALGAAGFTDVVSDRLTVTFAFDSAAAYTRFRREVSTMDVRLRAHYPAAAVEAAWRALTEAAAAFADADGRVVMENEVLLAVGTR